MAYEPESSTSASLGATAQIPAVPTIRQPKVNLQAAPSKPQRRRRGRWLRRALRLVIWVTSVCLMVVVALMVSAYITGFRQASGWPDVEGMLEWLWVNYDLAGAGPRR